MSKLPFVLVRLLQIRLMYILGKVLSVLPLDVIIASLNRVVGPCVDELRTLCSSREPNIHTKALLIMRLKMLATLCTTLDLRVSGSEDSSADETSHRQTLANQQQPVLLIAQQLLPLLKGVVDYLGTDEQITEVKMPPIYNFKCSHSPRKPYLRCVCCCSRYV